MLLIALDATQWPCERLSDRTWNPYFMGGIFPLGPLSHLQIQDKDLLLTSLVIH